MKSYGDILALAFAAAVSAMGRRRVLSCLWELTYRCNATCAICNYWRMPVEPERELTTAEIHQGLKKIHAYGCRFVNFTGGEPTLRDDLDAIIRRASGLGLWTSVVTNGSQLTPARVLALRDAGLDNLLVSLDSTEPSRHDTHRGIPGLHAKVLRSMQWLREGFLTGHRIGGVMFVLCHDNLRELPFLLELAENHGVYVVLQPYHRNKTGEASHEAACSQELADALQALKERSNALLASRAYLRGMVAFCNGVRPPPCRAGYKYFSIDPYGFLHPCVDMPSAGHVLRDDLSVVRSEQALRAVASCQGCWYCFRGEADSALTVRGFLEKAHLAFSVIEQNARRRHRPPKRGLAPFAQ